jgi:myo-inositol catabolism protein IolS
MNDLVREGKVRLKGLSAYSEDHFETLVPLIQPTVLQSWAHALDDHFVRPGSRLSQLMQTHHLSFVAFSPLAQGVLLDKFDPAHPPQFAPGDNRKDNKNFSPERLTMLKPKLQKLKARFGATTADLSAVALNYILAQPHVACVIPGFRNPRQAEFNVAGSGRTLSADDLQFIQDTLTG